MSCEDEDCYSEDSFYEYTDDDFENTSSEIIYSGCPDDVKAFDSQKSVGCQTNMELRSKHSMPLQTEYIEVKDQVIQCVNGDDDTKFLSVIDACRTGRLNEFTAGEQCRSSLADLPRTFLQNALTVCEALITTENSARSFQVKQHSNIVCVADDNCWNNVCDKEINSLLKGKRVTQIMSANSKGPLFITVHSPLDIESCSRISKKGTICLWRENAYDVKLCLLLVFQGRPTIARFLPDRVIICATEDGSMHVWNLSSSKIIDSSEKISSFTLLAEAVKPTLSTGWDISSLGSKHVHMSPIVGLEIVPDNSQADALLSQLISIDVQGEVIVWLLTDKSLDINNCIPSIGKSMSLHQMKGLSLKAASDVGGPLYSIEDMQHRNSIFDQFQNKLLGKRVLGMYLFPGSRNRCLVPLSDGHIVDCYLASGGPVKYYSKYSSGYACAESITFNPFVPDIFLVGWSDGSVSFFTDASLFSLRTFEPEHFFDNNIINSQVGSKVEWSRYNPTVFFVSCNHCIVTLDLKQDDLDLYWKLYDPKNATCADLANANSSCNFAITSTSDLNQNSRILAANEAGIMVRKLPKSLNLSNCEGDIKKRISFLKHYANNVIG